LAGCQGWCLAVGVVARCVSCAACVVQLLLLGRVANGCGSGVVVLCTLFGCSRTGRLELARRGYTNHNPHLLALTYQYANNQTAYTKLLHQIHNRLLRVLAAEAELRKQRSSRNALQHQLLGTTPDNQPTSITPNPIQTQPSQGTHLALHLPPDPTQNPSPDRHALAAIWCFLQQTSWAPTPANTNGASWLELFAHFTLCGGTIYSPPEPTDDHLPPHLPHTTFHLHQNPAPNSRPLPTPPGPTAFPPIQKPHNAPYAPRHPAPRPLHRSQHVPHPRGAHSHP
jgi:hypothetical protein